MKKLIALVIVFLTMLTFGAYGEEIPAWVNHQPKVWEETIGATTYVYAIGAANYKQNMTNTEALKNFQNAMNDSIQEIQKHLGVKHIKDYQVIGTWYEEPKMYILGVVPKAQSKAVEIIATPPVTEEPLTTAEATVIPVEEIAAESDSVGIKVRPQIPTEWWVFYEGPATPLQNVFRVGNDLYAIGKGQLNPNQLPQQQWPGARRAALVDAQKNLAAALNGVVTKIHGNGNYDNSVRGVVIGAQQVQSDGIENPHYDQKDVFVLLKLPLVTTVQKIK